MDTQPETVKTVVPEWTVGDRLRKARMSKKLLREQVCALDTSGEISPRMLGNFEANITIPKDSMVGKLAGLLGTDKNWLVTGVAPASAEDIAAAKALASSADELPNAAKRLELIENLLIAVVSENKKLAAASQPDVGLRPETEGGKS